MDRSWVHPEALPDLSQASMICIDLETRDPNLKTKGCGGCRGDGYVVGISVATPEGYCGYFPIRHEGGGNMDPDTVISWAKEQFASRIPKLGANILYDLEWLRHEGVHVGGPKYDIQIAEPLLDENRMSYSLDSLSEKYLGLHKKEDLMTEAAVELLGIQPKDVKSNLWKLPAWAVGPYAEMDTRLPLMIFNLQRSKLIEEDLWKLFDEVETPLVDCLLDMKFLGVPVDIPRAEAVRAQMMSDQVAAEKAMRGMIGRSIDIWSIKDIVGACSDLGLKFPVTDKGNPSFTASWLSNQEHPYLTLLVKARKLDRSGGVYIEDKILGMAYKGRIHPSFYQVRRDDAGTVSGRFSSANPNMQQIPSRDEIMAPLVRSIFVPEPGAHWSVFDYSQQEPRVTIHYANLLKLAGADVARHRFVDDPGTDYHQMVGDMAGIKRKPAKTLNLGLAYGMGKQKMSEELGVDLEEADRLFALYHAGVPFIKALGETCTRKAGSKGWLKTLLGRRRRFDLFGPAKWTPGCVPKPMAEAMETFGPPLKRYFTHKAMNALIQGSSADMIKAAMVQCHREGFTPHLTIHDELDFSLSSFSDMARIQDIMLNAVQITVPLKVDIELGKNWGDCDEVFLDRCIDENRVVYKEER